MAKIKDKGHASTVELFKEHDMKSVLKEKEKMWTVKQEEYYQIYEQIYERSDASFLQIGVNTGAADNAAGLLEEIYEDCILFPLHLTVKSAENHAACPKLRSGVNW